MARTHTHPCSLVAALLLSSCCACEQETDAPVDTVCQPLPEVAYDGIDQDCDGEDLTDWDHDGFDASEVGGPDCADDDP